MPPQQPRQRPRVDRRSERSLACSCSAASKLPSFQAGRLPRLEFGQRPLPRNGHSTIPAQVRLHRSASFASVTSMLRRAAASSLARPSFLLPSWPCRPSPSPGVRPTLSPPDRPCYQPSCSIARPHSHEPPQCNGGKQPLPSPPLLHLHLDFRPEHFSIRPEGCRTLTHSHTLLPLDIILH